MKKSGVEFIRNLSGADIGFDVLAEEPNVNMEPVNGSSIVISCFINTLWELVAIVKYVKSLKTNGDCNYKQQIGLLKKNLIIWKLHDKLSELFF